MVWHYSYYYILSLLVLSMILLLSMILFLLFIPMPLHQLSPFIIHAFPLCSWLEARDIRSSLLLAATQLRDIQGDAPDLAKLPSGNLT